MPVKPSTRKPRVRSVKEKQNNVTKPYDLLDQGNPNPTLDHNRAEDISVKGDTFKDPKIGLGDFWEAIKFYIDNKVKPSVVVNNQQIGVPVDYAFPERWNAAQKQGYLRDKDGRILLPAIAIKRDTIVRNRSLGNKLDGNMVHQYQVFKTGYSSLNQYDNFSVLTNSIPRREFRIAPVPDYVIITYNCSVYCNFQEDLDRIIQAFSYSADAYWGQVDLLQFKVKIDQFTDTIKYTQGDDRSVRADFNITLNGYLLPETIERDLSAKKKFISKAQVILRTITTSANPDIEIRNAARQNIIVGGAASVANNNRPPAPGLSTDIIKYINTNKEINATSNTSNVAVFTASFLPAPIGFPATSLDNFIFFANGQLIEKTAIISFVDNGSGQCILTVNISLLDYTFGSDYIITAIGKFL